MQDERQEKKETNKKKVAMQKLSDLYALRQYTFSEEIKKNKIKEKYGARAAR